jgi:hypothetical protein
VLIGACILQVVQDVVLDVVPNVLANMLAVARARHEYVDFVFVKAQHRVLCTGANGGIEIKSSSAIKIYGSFCCARSGVEVVVVIVFEVVEDFV